MLSIKRLYSFVIQTFIPLLLATFSVSWFVFLMQMLFKYIDDMVGKGADIKILGELFFFAAISLIPMALPLSILLASLMTFGNLGEKFELLAMKASGISLIKIMKPLIIVSIFFAGLTFVLQNYIIPTANTKFSTIIISLRRKAPELDIPEGSFFKGITNYSIYVKHKEKNGRLCDLMIYDYSKGADNAVVIVCDSGRISMSEDKFYLILTMYNGKSFQNFNKNKKQYYNQNPDQTPFLRENFAYRKVLISYDSNFNLQDESIMRSRETGKRMGELISFADSLTVITDSVAATVSPLFRKQVYESSFVLARDIHTKQITPDSIFNGNFQDFYNTQSPQDQLRILEEAKSKAERQKNDYAIRMYDQSEALGQIRRHHAEIHKRYALSFACILFFFIGAPLGAIIRKGGLGLPAVISILIFLLYYTVDTFGFKMVKQDILPAWQGMWLSTMMLAGMGIFLTYKSVNDSVMLDMDSWKESIERLFGKRETRVYYKKEVIMTPPDYHADLEKMEQWNSDFEKKRLYRQSFASLFISQKFKQDDVTTLVASMENYIEDLLNSDKNLIISKLMDYPVIFPINTDFSGKPAIRWLFIIIFPLGLLATLFFKIRQNQIAEDLKTVFRVNEEIIKELARW
jgi:lipopolysaccharide export system permease protein